MRASRLRAQDTGLFANCQKTRKRYGVFLR
jgi:hypothetical protein